MKPARSSAIRTLPFSDHDAARAAAEGRGMTAPLWSEAELARAFGAQPSAPPARPSRASRSTRARLQPGDLFFAIKGETQRRP